MPRSVIVLSNDPDFFEDVRATLRSDTRFIDVGDNVHCDGSVSPLTNIYPVEMNAIDWEDWDLEASEMPDPRAMSQLILECRSPEWVAEVGRLLARGVDAPVWIVDSAARAWPADHIDAARVVLA